MRTRSEEFRSRWGAHNCTGQPACFLSSEGVFALTC
ncbi:hypothetical protein [Arthrobacter sp. StoSoilB5]|nr:hypothetical protein [Arthrobacter sp. StoSoilB5]